MEIEGQGQVSGIPSPGGGDEHPLGNLENEAHQPRRKSADEVKHGILSLLPFSITYTHARVPI